MSIGIKFDGDLTVEIGVVYGDDLLVDARSICEPKGA